MRYNGDVKKLWEEMNPKKKDTITIEECLALAAGLLIKNKYVVEPRAGISYVAFRL